MAEEISKTLHSEIIINVREFSEIRYSGRFMITRSAYKILINLHQPQRVLKNPQRRQSFSDKSITIDLFGSVFKVVFDIFEKDNKNLTIKPLSPENTILPNVYYFQLHLRNATAIATKVFS